MNTTFNFMCNMSLLNLTFLCLESEFLLLVNSQKYITGSPAFSSSSGTSIQLSEQDSFIKLKQNETRKAQLPVIMLVLMPVC